MSGRPPPSLIRPEKGPGAEGSLRPVRGLLAALDRAPSWGSRTRGWKSREMGKSGPGPLNPVLARGPGLQQP